MQDSFTYFVQAEMGGPIKIGKAFKPRARLAELQACCPVRLVLLAFVRGSEFAEKDLHARFERSRLHGEWFDPVPELRLLIATIKSQIKPGDYNGETPNVIEQ